MYSTQMRTVRVLPALALAVSVSLGASPALADNVQKLRPGLWEITQEGEKSTAGEGYVNELTKRIDAISPSLRERLQRMIGKQDRFVSGNNKFCITRQQFKSAPVAAMGPEGCDEKITWDDMSGDGKVALSCPDGSTGRGQLNVVNPTTFGLLLQMSGGAAKKGRQVYSGKFVSSDCGGIQPR